MNFAHVALESLAYVEPDEIWTSADVERRLSPLYDRLQLPYGRLEHMTGIRERRFFSQPVTSSELSTRAGRAVLNKSRFVADDIDLLIHAAVCRDRLEPSTAAYVHRSLQLGAHAQFFDISNACVGFLNAIITAAAMIDAGLIRRVMIVAGEDGRPLVENTLIQLLQPRLNRKTIKPYFANLTIGAGAAAAVLCHSSLADDAVPRIQTGVVESDTTWPNLCEGGTAAAGVGLEMQTDSEGLLMAGIQVAQRAWRRFKAASGWVEDTADRIICHQVGKQHQRCVYGAMGIPIEKDFSTYPNYGNVGSVSLPLSLAKAVEAGAVQPNDQVALFGIGSGISCVMLAVQW